MGSPAQPTTADRLSIRQLAAAVIRAVEEDKDVTSFVQAETGLMIEDVLVEVCQEAVALRRERDAMRVGIASMLSRYTAGHVLRDLRGLLDSIDTGDKP